MYVTQKVTSDAFARALASCHHKAINTNISESARKALQKALDFIIRHLRDVTSAILRRLRTLLHTVLCHLLAGLKWSGSKLVRPLTSLWRFLRAVILSTLKWLGIGLATIYGAVTIWFIASWAVPKLWKIYTVRREKGLEEQRWRQHRELQERLLEESRMRRAAAEAASREAEALRNAAALREAEARERAEAQRAREQQATEDKKRREEDYRLKNAKKNYEAWERECKIAFKDKSSMTYFPYPSLPRCTTQDCRRVPRARHQRASTT